MKLCVLEHIRLTFDFYLRYLQTGCRNKLQESVAYVKIDDYYLINDSSFKYENILKTPGVY